MIAVLDHLGIERTEVLGHSMGGRTGLEMACTFPDRLIAVVAGGAHPYAQSMERTRGGVAAGTDVWADAVERMTGPLTPTARDRLRSNDMDALKAAIASDRPDISSQLASSGVPVMLFAGEEDPLLASAKRYSEEHGAPLLVLPGMNHMQAFMRGAERVVPEAVAFLNQQTR